MKVIIKKILTNNLILAKTIDVDISSASLLSKEDAEVLLTAEEKIFNDRWWILENSTDAKFPAVITTVGNPVPCYCSDFVYSVRPVLKFFSNSSCYRNKDKINFGGLNFTVISNNLAFCDSSIGKCLFRKDNSAEDRANYCSSDVKVFIDEWFNNLKEIYD